MSIHNRVTNKHPTIKTDYTAYTSGSNNTFDAAYNDYLSTVETIERAIRVHANVISMAKLEIFKKTSSGDLKPFKVKNVDLDFPNEFDSYVDFNRKLATSIYTQGAGLIVPEKGNGLVNFYNVNTAKITIEATGSKLIDNFVYTGADGSEIRYKPKDVIYVNDSIDPSNLVYSLSRLKSLNDVILIQAGIVNRVKEYTAGNAKESAIVSTSVPLAAETQKTIKGAFDDFMSSNTSQTLFVNTDLNVEKFSSSMSGTEMLAFFKEINKMVLEQYNIPPHLLGGLSAQGANKSDEVLLSIRIWFNLMVKPVLMNIELQMTRYFRQTLKLKDVVLKYSLAEVDLLDDPIDGKVDRAIKLSKAGLASINEARRLAELPELAEDVADYHFLPAYLLGSAPVSVENFDANIERLLQGIDTTGDTTSNMPAGNSGDEDNTGVVSDTRGGKQNE